MGVRVPDIEPSDPAHETVRAMAFWGVVLLPLTYLPVLYITDGSGQIALFVAIIFVNTCCLVVDQLFR